jgi:mono/diheme cytochrome c family protein
MRQGIRLLVCLALSASACLKSDLGGSFQHDVQFGGSTVSAATLNHGERFYLLHCAGCHGVNGDGRGSVGVTQIPAPRDLRIAVFKFASVPAGSLPTDEDLGHLLRHGLRGTGMQPWKFRDAEVQALSQYIKTFSPRWLNERPGTPVPMFPDPWKVRFQAAVARGHDLYHGQASCQSCHPAYDIVPPTRPAARATIFGSLEAPDLRHATVRAGESPQDLYRTLAAGVGGVGMEPLAVRLTGADIWALVYYVRSLREPLGDLSHASLR